MADRPGKEMAIAAVKKALAEEMQYEAPNVEARKNITERVAKAGREAEAEVKREMRGVMKAAGGLLKDVDAEENPGLAKLPENVRNKMGYKRSGGKVKKMAAGGSVSSASKRADGCAIRGKTKGRIV